jgi:hypothetical protein
VGHTNLSATARFIFLLIVLLVSYTVLGHILFGHVLAEYVTRAPRAAFGPPALCPTAAFHPLDRG